MSEGYVECWSYTRARRHPKVVRIFEGNPWPVTPTQLGVIAAASVLLLKTRVIWGALLPGALLHLLVIAGVPIAAARALRNCRPEGRTPVQALTGAMAYLARPRRGRRRGRPVRATYPTGGGGRIFVLVP